MDSDTGTKLDPRGHSPHCNPHRCTNERVCRNSIVYINVDSYHGSDEDRDTVSYAIANEHADSDSDIHTDRFAD